MSLKPPYALFVLDKDIDNEDLNECLQRAYDGVWQSWDIWVATISYTDMPPPQKPRQPPPPATQPPLPKDYTSPWVGKTVEECATWLQKAPIEDAVDTDNFLVMNEFSKDEDIILACRIVKGEDGMKVEYYPHPTGEVSMQMYTNDGRKWDEKALNYQRRQRAAGRPDRSRAGPYD
ncbi:hypothetical protein CC86DRAFT_370417 [Ophiobolus disseminans]|uniref:Uncharacterized protein n=1 Tax=Ophiobolus disseminans TaxID=1469910 RepID=A0A6A7A128_9PLEO|nr:hypothetical protein CC86DRAFT_370417 [Ophiobolus disseminans]